MQTTRLRFTLIAIALASLMGCATASKTIFGREYPNVEPFARQTATVLSVERLDFRGDQVIYLRQSVDDDSREVQRLRGDLTKADRFRDEVISYSVELMRVAVAGISGLERNAELALLLQEMRHDGAPRRDTTAWL